MARIKPWQAALLAGAAVSAAIAFLACVDTTPVTVQGTPFDGAPPVLTDAFVDVSLGDASRDGQADAAVETGPSPCVQCLEMPDMMGHGCGNEVAACMANAKCAQAISCAIADDCFDRGSSAGLIQCGFPCATDAGITLTDPAIQLAYDVFTCAASNCGTYCKLGD
ncbi:MAG TPA: hypothetical protein VF765_11365 [Polyangiaceae bacterium]